MAGLGSHRQIATTQRAHARRLRASMTDAEIALWSALRGGRLLGAHFRRQVPIGPYVVDFCCHAARLVVEVDGGQHGTPDGLAADRRRTARLAGEGYRVLRFWNHEVLAETAAVLEVIAAALLAAGVGVTEAATPLPVPPPQGGRGPEGAVPSLTGAVAEVRPAGGTARLAFVVPSPLVGEGQGEGCSASPLTPSSVVGTPVASDAIDARNRGQIP